MFIIPLRYSSTARDHRASTTLSHQKKEEKKDSSPCAITWAFGVHVDVWVCLCVCASVCMCMSYLWVHLRHWAAGYAALKGCVSAAMSISLSLCSSLTLRLFLLMLCLCVRVIHHLCSVHLYSIISALSLLFSKDKAKCWRSVSLTAFHIQHREWLYAIWEGSWLALAVLRT